MTVADVALRPMRRDDLAAVMAIERVLFADDAWTEGMFRSELAQRRTRHYVVAVEDDVVVGYAGLCAYAADQAFVQTIGVRPQSQRRGIGHRLLHELIAEAERRHCAQLDLEVRAGNDPAIALYDQHGFTTLGVRRGYYQPSGADAIVMRRASSSPRDAS